MKVRHSVLVLTCLWTGLESCKTTGAGDTSIQSWTRQGGNYADGAYIKELKQVTIDLTKLEKYAVTGLFLD